MLRPLSKLEVKHARRTFPSYNKVKHCCCFPFRTVETTITTGVLRISYIHLSLLSPGRSFVRYQFLRQLSRPSKLAISLLTCRQALFSVLPTDLRVERNFSFDFARVLSLGAGISCSISACVLSSARSLSVLDRKLGD